MREPSPVSVSLALRQLTKSVGADLAAYILASDITDLGALFAGEAELSQQQLAVLATTAAGFARLPAKFVGDVRDSYMRGWLMQTDSDGRTLARRLNETIAPPQSLEVTGLDEMEKAIALLTIDVYPALLLPHDYLPVPVYRMSETTSTDVTRVIHRHPMSDVFVRSLQADPIMGPRFTDREHMGTVATMYDNAGQYVTFQVAMVVEDIISVAFFRKIRRGGGPTELAKETVKQLGLLRRIFAGDTNRIKVASKIGLAGILLPSGTHYKIGNGTIREMSYRERHIAPPSLKGKLEGTDADGQRAVINYEGDVVFEYRFPYRTRFDNPVGTTATEPWPEDMLVPPDLEQTLTRLRFSLMLAVTRQHRVQIAPTWRLLEDPVIPTRAVSWSDPRTVPGLMPTSLSDNEVAAWLDWFTKLDTPSVKRIDLALARIIRAQSERFEPSDVLIDSVIAWENLFGTSEGEPTFRVTMCLAVLLETEFKARLELRQRLAKIYSLRSKVVHGALTVKTSDHPRCFEALDVAIRAIRVLVSERRDILDLASGAERSATLLLGSGVAVPYDE